MCFFNLLEYTIDVRSSRLKPGSASAKICLSAWVDGKALKDADEILRAKAPADRFKKLEIAA